MTPSLSLVVMAIGPERVVDRAMHAATQQTVADAELVIVHDRDDEAARVRLQSSLNGRPATFIAAGSMSPGAARNAAVRGSRGTCFLIIDGGERLAPDFAGTALQALGDAPDTAFAAPRSEPLFGSAAIGPAHGSRIDADTLAGGAWFVGPAVIRRQAFDHVGPFDESLPALVDWAFLLALAEAGLNGLLLPDPAPRYSDDDVRLREALRAQSHLPAVTQIISRHRGIFDTLMRAALVERERTLKALFEYERALLARRQEALSTLSATLDELATLRPALRQHGLSQVDFADLRRASPISRNWGSERGLPIDRHYIHKFLAKHADDVRGHVLEMLDADLTTTYGRDRVVRSDVLDIDPGNARASVIADLRVREQLPADAYDCFILTQTLHLIDDVHAALQTAYQLLKPGGVLLATLPCASMVATEYGSRGDHWRVTEAGARALFERVFRPADLDVHAHGNLLTTTAFLHGLSCEDLDQDEFAPDDAAYPLIISVRARKAAAVRRPTSATPKAGAAILLYHRVAELPVDSHSLAVSPGAFRSQIETLRASWHVLPLRTLTAAAVNGDVPERGIALTFDDGYLDNLEIAAPILAELGVPATFFLTSEPRPHGRRFWWDALEEMWLLAGNYPENIVVEIAGQLQTFEASKPSERRASHDKLYSVFKTSPPVVRDDLLGQMARQTSVPLTSTISRPMTAAEVCRLSAYPSIEVGAHSVHHLSLPNISAEDCHREVFESRSSLERLTGRSLTSFAYPFGDLSQQAVEAVMAAGFECAVTCAGRGLEAREHPLRMPRIPTCEESGSELDARLLHILAGATPATAES